MRADRLRLLTALALGGVILALVPTCAKIPLWRAELERVGIRFVSAKELKLMMDRGDEFVLVDARDEVHYDRGHIRGAISIPAEDKPLRDVDVRRPKRLMYPERLPADRDRPLVFYCGGPTWAQSLDAAVAAYHMGFRRIMVMHGGDKEWYAEGYRFE